MSEISKIKPHVGSNSFDVSKIKMAHNSSNNMGGSKSFVNSVSSESLDLNIDNFVKSEYSVYDSFGNLHSISSSSLSMLLNDEDSFNSFFDKMNSDYDSKYTLLLLQKFYIDNKDSLSPDACFRYRDLVDNFNGSEHSLNVFSSTGVQMSSGFDAAMTNSNAYSEYLKFINSCDYEHIQLELKSVHFLYSQLVNGEVVLDSDLMNKIIYLNKIYENSVYDSMGVSTTFLHYNISDFLSDNGSSVEDFNNSIKSAVVDAGPGTREGVVAAIKSLSGQLLDYNVRLPYVSSIDNTTYGKYSGYGINPEWGNNEVLYSKYYNFYYYQNGLDCSGLMDWAIHNGGYRYKQCFSGLYHDNFGELHDPSEFRAKPGDILWRSGHVAMIVDIKGDNYVVAEEHGGSFGLTLSEYDINKPGTFTKVIDMTSFYNDDKNKDLDFYN